MSTTDELVQANSEYAKTFDRGDLPMPPARESRSSPVWMPASSPREPLGLEEGDAHVIRNAGGRARDALRSLVISQRLLGTNEIAVIHHTDCGMLTFTNRDLHAKVKQDLDADSSNIDFLPFSDLEESVREDVAFLLSSPLIPATSASAGSSTMSAPGS